MRRGNKMALYIRHIISYIGTVTHPLRRTLGLLLLIISLGTGTVWGQTNITSLSEITNADGHYIITADITGGTPGVTTFNGILEANIDQTTHMPYRVKNLSAPLFTTLTGTVRNLVLENVNITSGTDVGAIACNMTGTSANKAVIYNVGVLSGSISGSGKVGGLVGVLGSTSNNDQCYARVINCYSFADIEGGSQKAGIVGHNCFATKYDNQRTMVMNCMFYGDISSGGSIYPIYGGENISNDYNNNTSNRLNNYNYFLYEAPFSKSSIITSYNCALAAEERFLVRFEFYRHLLNSTRELAAWYATGVPADGRGIGSANKMEKWVLDKSIAPYPILKEQGKYYSVVNYDPDNTYNENTGQIVSRSSVTTRNQGGTIKVNSVNQTLTIYISNSKTTGGQEWPTGANVDQQFRPGNAGITRYRTDKDVANYNFNYDKVQLPYYNDVGTNNYTGNKVVTGWKIISMEGGTAGGYTETNYDAPHYNYADRDHTGKDLYTVSNRIFAQGAYFNVPTGVTSITIEPYWGKAAYLSDANYDRYGYNNTDNLSQVGGTRYTNNTDCPLLSGNQKVFTTVGNALGALTGVDNATVYDYAIVLVGNYHHHVAVGKGGPELSNGTTPFTIMSIDLNQDNEPDYCLIYRSGKNQQISPIRFDFITVPGIVMAHKMATHGDLGIPGNCCPKGWFEVTTTGLIKYGQFEHSFNGKSNSPLILMGGVIDQFVANNTGTTEAFNNKTKYMLFGDNVWFKMLSNGNHMDKSQAMPHRPISLVGGEYEKLYLSGYFRPDAAACNSPNGDKNAECYIDGGLFGEVAGAGQENINGNVTWIIDHADIKSFFGGGIKASNANQITGTITTTVKNSYIDLFCGGPKFGDMAAKQNVTTTATDCTFGTYFGAGYGGTSIYRECPKDYNKFEAKNYDFNGWLGSSYNNSGKSNYRGKYTSGKGIACGYEYELFAGSAGNVGRLFLQYASFSLAKTNNVSSTLTGCTITGNFYGGGSLGKVDGTATSTLNNCIVNGNVYGAGYSATIPTAGILSTAGFTVNGEPTNPNYNEATGVYEKADVAPSTAYTWVHEETNLSNGNQTLVDNGDVHTIKTNEDLDGLGRVTGKVTLNINGNTIVKGNVVRMDNDGFVVKDANGEPVVTEFNTGGIFGGGDSSDAENDTEVTINTPTQRTEGYNVYNVFGGGNNAEVYGDTKVILQDGMIFNNVYGGGNKGNVRGNAEVDIED